MDRPARPDAPSAHRNRLADELSPYLVQHAGNPVDWYPWGSEALARARALDRPILLSIGYSACHWCHVMERESFEDEPTAALMNARYVCIKVDREERPDLDHLYQTTVQLTGRGGGWPLTVFLTPALEPFYAGTYFPPVERHGMPSFGAVLRAASEAYEGRREHVEQTAHELARVMAEVTAPQESSDELPTDLVMRACKGLLTRIDPLAGGFGHAPKFPNTLALDVLLRAHDLGDPEALGLVEKALDAMRDGGIHDQLGGGFHRYATDARWLVPHFEKMLYDNALIARLFADVHRLTGAARMAETARETLDYLLREMRAPGGGFYSSQDADSEGEEGRFFVFRPEELERVLGDEAARAASLFYGVTPHGNFDHGATVLHRARSVAQVAEALGADTQEVERTLAAARRALLTARELRPRPLRDEKIIAAWNGLAISAFADAGGALGEVAYVEVARAALAFHRGRGFRDGRLLRIHRDERSATDAFLEDYGCLAGAALDVYEACFDPAALAFARALADAALELFWDEEAGGLCFTRADQPDLLLRTMDLHDGATPSGTSTLCQALLRLHEHVGDPRYLARAERVLRRASSSALRHPFGAGHLVCAVDRLVRGATRVVIVAAPGDEAGEALAAAARAAYVPNRVLLRADPAGPTTGPLPYAGVLPAAPQVGGRATAYVCHARTCAAPVTTPAQLRAALIPASRAPRL